MHQTKPVCRTRPAQRQAECLVSGQGAVHRLALDPQNDLLWAATADSSLQAWRLQPRCVQLQPHVHLHVTTFE